MYAICLEGSRDVIGTVKIGEIDSKSMVSDLVTVVGKREYWGKNIGSKAIKEGTKKAFKEHGIRKLHGGMYADNVGSIKAHLRGGWVIESVLVGHYFVDKKPVDRVVVGCFNPDFFDPLPVMPTTRFDGIIS